MNTQAAEVGASFELVTIDPTAQLKEIKKLWAETIRPFLVEAIESQPTNPEESPEDVLNQILSRHYNLNLVKVGDDIVGVVVIRATAYPKFFAIHICYMAGKNVMFFANRALSAIIDLAKKAGYKRIECVTHDAIANILEKKAGFTRRNYMVRDL